MPPRVSDDLISQTKIPRWHNCTIMHSSTIIFIFLNYILYNKKNISLPSRYMYMKRSRLNSGVYYWLAVVKQIAKMIKGELLVRSICTFITFHAL